MTVPLLESRLLGEVAGIVHAFTTREGGLSEGNFASLNLGIRTADERSVVETNRRRLLTSLGRGDCTFITLCQVHGTDVVQVNHLAGRSIEADGIWTRDRRAVIAVLTADCVPILLTDEAGTFAAAVHAGWRGTRSRIVTTMVKRLVAAGVKVDQLRAAIGPAIGPCCFEIGPEVAEELIAAYPEAGDAIRRNERDHWIADLWSLNEIALHEAGIGVGRIDILRHCSKCDERFFSHRRDGAGGGRQVGVIGLRG